MTSALHVGRTAIRETFRRLEALGIVETRQGFGRVLREFNFDSILDGLSFGLASQTPDIVEILGIRKALDAYYIAEAMPNITIEDIEVLSGIVKRMEERQVRNLDINQGDHDFHEL